MFACKFSRVARGGSDIAYKLIPIKIKRLNLPIPHIIRWDRAHAPSPFRLSLAHAVSVWHENELIENTWRFVDVLLVLFIYVRAFSFAVGGGHLKHMLQSVDHFEKIDCLLFS